MAHPTRGHRSHTFDIKQVHAVDLDELAITYTDAAHAGRQQVILNAVPSPAARQVLQAMADSISVYGDGQWQSSVWLNGFASSLSRLLGELTAAGVDDLGSESVDLRLLRSCIERFHPTTKRSLNKLVARVLREHHPNGSGLATALRNTSYMVKEPRVELYDDAEVDSIEAAARGVFLDAYRAQRAVFQQLGYDVDGRGWLRTGAPEILADARNRRPAMEGALEPPGSAPHAAQLDWALLNPGAFGIGQGRRVIGGTLLAIGDALYPANAVLTAALIIHCLAENSGINLSVMLRTEPDDLVYTGLCNGMLDVAKARSHSEDALPVRTSSMFSTGGLVETLTGLTRFPRYYRAVALASSAGVPEVANRLYVEHKRDANRSEVLTTARIHNGWRSPNFDRHWPSTGLDRSRVGLRFTALRRKALERVIRFDPAGDVHGHNERTRVHYLANVLPEHTLVRHATAAQDDILDRALRSYRHVADSDDPRARSLAESDDVADVILGSCTSGGNDPDDTDTPCSLGLAACFTCPNGYRTVDHIPGLLATVELSELIRENDPHEWEHGDAAVLHHYATASLAQFPTSVVDRIRVNVDIAPHLVNLTGLYTELRR